MLVAGLHEPNWPLSQLLGHDRVYERQSEMLQLRQFKYCLDFGRNRHVFPRHYYGNRLLLDV